MNAYGQKIHFSGTLCQFYPPDVYIKYNCYYIKGVFFVEFYNIFLIFKLIGQGNTDYQYITSIGAGHPVHISKDNAP